MNKGSLSQRSLELVWMPCSVVLRAERVWCVDGSTFVPLDGRPPADLTAARIGWSPSPGRLLLARARLVIARL